MLPPPPPHPPYISSQYSLYPYFKMLCWIQLPHQSPKHNANYNKQWISVAAINAYSIACLVRIQPHNSSHMTKHQTKVSYITPAEEEQNHRYGGQTKCSYIWNSCFKPRLQHTSVHPFITTGCVSSNIKEDSHHKVPVKKKKTFVQ